MHDPDEYFFDWPTFVRSLDRVQLAYIISLVGLPGEGLHPDNRLNQMDCRNAAYDEWLYRRDK